jgi:acetyltransferase-like isoleucine patch superfamily enzyme
MILIRYLLKIGNKVANLTYTIVMRGSFASWGKHTQLGRHAKISGAEMIHVGNDVLLGEHIWLNAKDSGNDGEVTLYIEDGTYIGRFVQINAWHSVSIGRNVLIADRVYISDADHNHDDINEPISKQGDSFIGGVTLGDGCWIGIGAVILPNVTIGRNAVIAANAVVTKNVPDFAIVGGVPAKIIKKL